MITIIAVQLGVLNMYIIDVFSSTSDYIKQNVIDEQMYLVLL
jgi:hypothetical protein